MSDQITDAPPNDVSAEHATLSARTIFDDPDPAANPDHAHFYDQIAWLTGANGEPALSLGFSNAGMFNFADGLVPADTPTQGCPGGSQITFPSGPSSRRTEPRLRGSRREAR
jgi:hypothetical protein